MFVLVAITMDVAVSEADVPFDENMSLLRQKSSSHSVWILSTYCSYKPYVLRFRGSSTFSYVNESLEREQNFLNADLIYPASRKAEFPEKEGPFWFLLLLKYYRDIISQRSSASIFSPQFIC